MDVLEKMKIHRVMAVHVEEIEHCVFKEYEHIDSDMAHGYTDMIKIELICQDEEVGKIKSAIMEKAQTGYQWDGIVIVSPVEEAVSIRTGKSI